MNKVVKLTGLDPVAHIRNGVGSNPTRGTNLPEWWNGRHNVLRRRGSNA